MSRISQHKAKAPCVCSCTQVLRLRRFHAHPQSTCLLVSAKMPACNCKQSPWVMSGQQACARASACLCLGVQTLTQALPCMRTPPCLLPVTPMAHQPEAHRALGRFAHRFGGRLRPCGAALGCGWCSFVRAMHLSGLHVRTSCTTFAHIKHTKCTKDTVHCAHAARHSLF